MNIFFVSLGCDKNLVDSENMLGILADSGYIITDEEEMADIIIINTCCFINDAKQESINAILEMAEYKKSGSCKWLIVAGCMAQRYKEEILKEIPEVDALLGTTSFTGIIEIIDRLKEGEKQVRIESLDKRPQSASKRLVSTGTSHAYLKIAEGCDKHCTYCIIPKLRGSYRSIPMEELLSEAEYLAGQGIKELILVAQETTLYGADLYGRKALPELLKGLCRIEGFEWIRIMYCYPEEITPELVAVIREEPKICRYLDLPIQHASDRILRLMGRKTCKEDLLRIITMLRRELPDVILRTTLITGFPTETEEEHAELMDFISSQRFDRLGVFTYSREEGTPAASLKPQMPARIKRIRQRQLYELQQSIAFQAGKERIGKTYDVLIEGRITDEENVYIGRTYMDAPSVDGSIFVNSGEELMSGRMVKVLVTGARDYDLIGDIVKGSAVE
jgi:ribosomal protein S12 methylthiotransferase